MGPNGSENVKMLLLLQIAAKVSSLSQIFLPLVLIKLRWGIWNFEFSIFNDFFLENFKFTTVACGEIKTRHLSENQAIVEQNEVKFGTLG